MLKIDSDGIIVDHEQLADFRAQRMRKIERGTLKKISGVIVHQTGSSNVNNTINGYSRDVINTKGKTVPPNGAHFLISKEGQVIQTASLNNQTQHVGNLRSKAIAEWACVQRQQVKGTPEEINAKEMQKEIPDRYPSNSSSVGIEMVGLCNIPNPIITATLDCLAQTELKSFLEIKGSLPAEISTTNIDKSKEDKLKDIAGIYDRITDAQQVALDFLMEELSSTFDISWREIYRHPTVSSKNNTEASSARITKVRE